MGEGKGRNWRELRVQDALRLENPNETEEFQLLEKNLRTHLGPGARTSTEGPQGMGDWKQRPPNTRPEGGAGNALSGRMNGEGGPEGGAREGPRDGRGTDPFPRPNPCPESPGRSGSAPPALTAGLVSYIGSRHLENANHFRREGWGTAPSPPEVEPHS